MKKHANGKEAGCERVIFTLPQALADQLRDYADHWRGGNKSGFVADALRAYMEHLSKIQHTRKLREAYAASAERSRKVAQEWEHVDAELSERPSSSVSQSRSR